MHKQNLMPNAAQPVNRTSTSHLPSELTELTEEALSQQGADASYSTSVLASIGDVHLCIPCVCSYDGDDAE